MKIEQPIRHPSCLKPPAKLKMAAFRIYRNISWEVCAYLRQIFFPKNPHLLGLGCLAQISIPQSTRPETEGLIQTLKKQRKPKLSAVATKSTLSDMASFYLYLLIKGIVRNGRHRLWDSDSCQRTAPLKGTSPMAVTDSGMVTLAKDLHP